MIHIHEESARCLLCAAAPCGAQAARAIRALRFDNNWTAAELFEKMTDAELQSAENACIHYDKPIRFTELKQTLNSQLNNCSKLSTLNSKLRIVAWTVIAYDWDHALSPEDVYQNVIRNACDGAIVAFHDSLKAYSNMISVLPRVLEYYSQKGFVFKNI